MLLTFDLTFYASYTRSLLFAFKLRTSHENLVVDSDNVMNVRQDGTAKRIFHDFDNHFDFYFFIFFFLCQPALKMFSNNFEITNVFQCLIQHFYLIHVRMLSSNLYLTRDSVCNYTSSSMSIQVKRRIGIIFESFIGAPFWCDASQRFAVVCRNLNI